MLSKKLTTNWLRSKWDTNVSPLCFYCKESNETIEHIYLECQTVKMFYRALIKWINYILNVDIVLSNENKICANFVGARKASDKYYDHNC